MPTYQYACTSCAHQLEAVQSFSDDPLTECPECAGRLRKRFNSVGIVFKGSGFYRTDSRAAASAGKNGSGAGSESGSGSGSGSTAAGGDSGKGSSTSGSEAKSGGDSAAAKPATTDKVPAGGKAS